MANNMTAALIFTLNDRLTAGLNRFKQQFESLRDLGKSLGLGKLENGAGILDRTASAARSLTSSLHGVVGMADRAWAAIKRMGSGAAEWGKRTFGPMSNVGALGAAAQGISVAVPVMMYASFEDTLRHIAITKGLSGTAVDPEIKRLKRLIDREALEGSQSSEFTAATYYALQTGGAGTSDQIEEALRAHGRAATAYKTDYEVFTPVTLALMKNFKIFGDDLARSLSAVGQASKEGQLKITDFASVLPQVAGAMNTAGMTGFANANLAMAMLQTIRTDVGEAGQAGTDFNEMLSSMYTSQGQKGFALEGKGSTGKGPGSFVGERARALMKKATGSEGIDISTMIDEGAKQGIGPIDVVLRKLTDIKSKLSAHEFSDLLSQMFTNEGARKGWQAAINHYEKLMSLRDELDRIDASKAATDFGTASAGPEAGVRRAEEGGTQVARRVGEGFAPLLTPLNAALGGILSATDKLDDKLPGLGNDVLMVAGGLLSLAVVMGVIGMAAPAVAAGWAILTGLLSGALGVVRFVVSGFALLAEVLGGILGVSATVAVVILAVAAVLVGAAVDIYENWDRFSGYFDELWQGVKDIFLGFLQFIGDMFTGDLDAAWRAIKRIFSGFGEYFGGILGIAKQLFLDFVGVLDGWTGGAVIATLHAIRDAVGSVIDKVHEWIKLLKNGPLVRLLGRPDDRPGDAGTPDVGTGGLKGTSDFSNLPGAANANVNIVIGWDDFGRPMVVRAKSDSPAVQVPAPNINPGQTLGRP